MDKFVIGADKLKIEIQIVILGDDICITFSGGDKPHIGCAVISIPRPSLSDKNETSCTTSVFNIVGHKDDYVACYISERIAKKFNKTIVVTGGIHIENITLEEIEDIKLLADEVVKEICTRLRSFRV